MDMDTETVMDTGHGHKLGHGQGHWSLITRSLGIVTDTTLATDTYTATDKVENTVTDIETDIERTLNNSAEGMFTGIAKHTDTVQT